MNKIASLAILAKKFGASEIGQRMMRWYEANLLWSGPGQVVSCLTLCSYRLGLTQRLVIIKKKS